MRGTLRKLVSEKKYGFIKTEKTDYFFHKENFDGHWDDLATDHENGIEITMEFEPIRTDKGLRAEEVRRVDNG